MMKMSDKDRVMLKAILDMWNEALVQMVDDATSEARMDQVLNGFMPDLKTFFEDKKISKDVKRFAMAWFESAHQLAEKITENIMIERAMRGKPELAPFADVLKNMLGKSND